MFSLVCFKVSILFSQPAFLALCCIQYCHCCKVLTFSGMSPSLCSSIKLWFSLNLCISHKFQKQFVNCQIKTTTQENLAGILIGITWNLEIILGKTDTFTTPSTNEYMERGQASRTTGGRAKWDNHWETGSWAHAHTVTQSFHSQVHAHTPRTYMHTPHSAGTPTYIHAHSTYIHAHTTCMHAHSTYMHGHSTCMHAHTTYTHTHTTYIHAHTSTYMHQRTCVRMLTATLCGQFKMETS